MYRLFDELLRKNNVSIYAVAKATGLSTATLYSWRSGEYQPKLDKLQKIADYFGVDVTYFLEQETDK